jgi:polyribonucleotide nucleotidyltransferase
MAHGSSLFTRGQTQALVVATLGTEMDKQSATLLTDSGNRSENFMFHYNFPGFSVGEASRIGAPGRRELGHGNLAKRALEGTVAGFDGAIRVVSEILESNGSSSMASVCGGSLALAASNVECTDLVAGVAMGLVTEGDRYEILTDIMGLEDHDGDMDFKVAGTRNGITALQMDIKLGGISYELLTQALDQAKEGRLHILGLMEEAATKIVINEKVLPSTEFFTVAADKIVDIIGQAGKTIREIIEKFEVAIDLDRAAGGVKVVGRDKEKVMAAKEHILDIVSRPKMGKPGARAPIDTTLFKVDNIYTGPVKKVADFGAFVEIAPGIEGMVHISKMGKGRISNIHDVVKEGDTLEVKVLAVSGSKIELGLTNPF